MSKAQTAFAARAEIAMSLEREPMGIRVRQATELETEVWEQQLALAAQTHPPAPKKKPTRSRKRK